MIVALAGLVALTVVASIVTLYVSADYFVSLSHEREEAQARNALDLKLQRLRAARVDESDRSFVLGANDQPIDARAQRVKLPPDAYAIVAAQAAPLVAQARSRGGDAAAFAVVESQPTYLVVAPAGAVRSNLLVSVHDVDQTFLADLSKSLLIERISLAAWPNRVPAGDAELALTGVSGQRVATLHWRTQHYMGDLIARLAPFALALLLVVGLAAVLVLRFIRRSTRDLSVTHHQARHDELTGLANRRLLMERLADALANPREGAALLFVDLDRFKDVNDIWGHEAGDAVLRTAAKRIKRLFPRDTAARFGGDEFVVLLTGDLDTARKQGAALLAVLGEPHVIDGVEVALPGSIGIAAVSDPGVTADELLRRADLALYQAKTRGRGRVVAFEPSMDADLHHRRRIESDLRRAIESDAIEVLYQPKVCARTNRILGVEALARFGDREGRRVSPSLFVPIAEESGLIIALGERVLRIACADAVRWSEIGVAVNLSPAQFRADDIVELVRSVLHESGLPPTRLTLEITEGVLVKDPDGARRRLDALRAMGVKLALDDFGTGYSSLVYLQRFKLDSLKIAQGFLDGLAPDTDAMTVLGSIVTLGHALGLTVVAEGVETVRQVELLKRAGADEFQGNIFAEPVTRAVLESALLSGDGAVIHIRQAATRAV